MEQLKAFVGHSFEVEDEEVVRFFLGYFDSLKDTVGLEWDHAKRAELTELSRKVREKMQGKNLFIGIFTRRDYRISPGSLKSASFRNKKCVKVDDLQWGTSDWLVQESGYALAKNMEPLFILEDGLRSPGGLQGNIEYVSFKRGNLGECIPKLNEMIGSVVRRKKPKPAADTSEPAASTKTAQEELKDDKEGDGKKIKKVDKEDGFKRNFDLLRKSIFEEKDIKKADAALEQIIDEHKSDKEYDETYWRGLSYRLKMIVHIDDAMNDLIELSKANDDDPRLKNWLGDSYKEYRNYPKAAEQYLMASKRQRNKIAQITTIGNAAECYAKNKQFGLAYDLVLKVFEETDLEDKCYHQLYKQLARISKLEKNDDLYFPVAEKALEYSPFDSDLRFSLAYRYANTGKYECAIFHYALLTQHKPSGPIWNNLGVAYSNLGVELKSVDAYKSAANEYNHTLAMSNLAFKYLDVGFAAEAEDVLRRAREMEDQHENVDGAMKQLHEQRSAEESQIQGIYDALEEERKFLVKYAECYTLPKVINIDGKWDSKHGKIGLKVDGKMIVGKGEFKISEPANVLAYGLAIRETTPKQIIKTTFIDLIGEVRNRGISYKLTIRTEPERRTLLTSDTSTFKGLICISEDGDTLEVMEYEKDKKSAEYYKMIRIREE